MTAHRPALPPAPADVSAPALAPAQRWAADAAALNCCLDGFHDGDDAPADLSAPALTHAARRAADAAALGCCLDGFHDEDAPAEPLPEARLTRDAAPTLSGGSVAAAPLPYCREHIPPPDPAAVDRQTHQWMSPALDWEVAHWVAPDGTTACHCGARVWTRFSGKQEQKCRRCVGAERRSLTAAGLFPATAAAGL